MKIKTLQKDFLQFVISLNEKMTVGEASVLWKQIYQGAKA